MDGWIKIHRRIKKHWVWNNDLYFKAWIGILLTVNHEDKKVLIEGELLECKRGESLNSLSSWVKIFGKKWTIQRVRTFFELLKQDKMINTEGLRKTTRLTVCNYDNYQLEQQANNKQITSKQQADNNEVTTNKNDKKEKNERECKEREIVFKNEVYSFNHYPKELQDEFIRYWIEPNKSKTKMRWELEKTWDTNLRLVTWEKRSSQFKQKTTGNTTPNLPKLN